MSDFVGKKDIIQAGEINAEIGSVVKSFEGLKKTIGDVAKSAIDMQNSLGGKAAYLQLIAESKQLAENTKALNDAKKEELRLQALLVKNKLAEQKRAEAAASKEAAKAERMLAIERKKTLASEKIQIANRKLILTAMSAEKGSIQQLTAVNKLLQVRMKELNVLIPEQAKRYTLLQNAVKNNNQAMMQQAMINPTLIGGNKRVASSFNGIQFQVTQLARELPALAYGPQMFIAAISNNFPMLQDEIKRVRIQNKLLAKAGEETVSIGKQIAKSILSWQTAIVVLITAYMMFHKEINTVIRSIFNYTRAIDVAKETQKALNNAMDDGSKSAGDEISKLKALYTISQDDTRTREDRLNAVNELQKIYPKYLENIDDESFLVGGAYQQYQLLTRAILDNAIAKAKLNEVTKIGIEIYEEEKKLFDIGDNINRLQADIVKAGDILYENSPIDIYIKNLYVEIAKLEKKRDEALTRIGDHAEKANRIISTITASDLIEDEKAKKVENDRLQMLRLRNKAEIEHNKAAAEQIIRERANLLEKEVMTDIQKNDILLDLREKLDKDILERQLALEEEIRDLGGWSAKERMDIEKQVADYTNDLEKDVTDSFIDNIKRENDKLDEQFKLLQLLHEARLEQVKAQTGTQRGSEGAAIEANYSFQEYKEIQFAEMKLRLRQQEIDAEIAMIEEQKTKLRKEEFAEAEKLNGQIEKLRKESADNIADYQIKKMEEVTNFEREQIVYRLGIELLNDEINKFAEVRNKILDGDWFEAENKLADAANKVLKMIIGKKKYSKEQINQMLIDANRALLKNEIETLREFLKIDERTIDEFINNEHKIAEALSMSAEEWEDYAAAAGIDPEEYQTKYKELLEIIKEFLQKEIDLIANPENSLKDWLKVVQDMVNSLFDIIDAYYERRRQAAENLYKAETKYAGTSVEQKLEAERKLDKELTKIRKKQSIAQKMQSIFNIGLQNLEAIPKAAGGDPLAIAQLIAAGLAMTAVIAEPIPAYEKGGKHKKSGLAKVSEKGQEIFIDNKTGKSYLTPKDETIAHFPAGEFIPHDETQRLLANYAMSQTREMVDMTNTNKYLSSIANNTKNTQSVNYVDGYKIVKRNGVTSKIKI